MDFIKKNIIETGKPSWSARWVAELRAVHQLLDDPIIFNDPMALSILGPCAEAHIRNDLSQFNDPITQSIRAGLVVRSRLAEDKLRQSMEFGVKQYVVLGAGLDTFSLRNSHHGKELQVYEVDHPSTQNWKKSILAEAYIDVPKSVIFVAVDFETKTLEKELQKSGFRTDQPTYFSWLGVTVYLSTEAIFETLKFVASLPKGSGITFDYRVPPSLLSPMEIAIGEHIAKFITEQGEPWKTSFDPTSLQQKLQRIGFHKTEDFGSDELNARYLAKRKDGLQTRMGFHLIYAEK
jgi:methyltransferase (TIGR00027 family)